MSLYDCLQEAGSIALVSGIWCGVVPSVARLSWGLEQFHLTFFPVEAVTEPRALWTAAQGTEPEEELIRRQQQATVYTASRSDDAGHLSLQVSGGGTKIDWFLGSTRGTELVTEVLIVGPVLERIRDFKLLVDSWCSGTFVVAARLAVGAVLLAPVDSKEAGYARLSNCLPFVEFGPNASDFFYRINRRRSSKTLPTEVNRLSEWSVAALQSVSTADGSPSPILTSAYMCRVGLDVNIAPSFRGSLSAAEQSEALGELTELALEIAREGDVP